MSGSNDRNEKWVGGYVRVLGEGPLAERVYVIRKMVGGVRYEVSTHRGNEVDALLELQKFKRGPATYDPTPPPDLVGDEGPSPIWLNSELVEEYLKHCSAVGTSHQWWNAKRRFLGWWLEKLHGVDLRGADLKLHILLPLHGASSRQQRIAVIKAFYAWLRDANSGKGVLTAAEDPTLATLKVPQRAPAQQTERRAFSVKDLNAVKKELAKQRQGRWRLDAVEVLAGTGWHYSELLRFAEAGTIMPMPASQMVRRRPPRKAAKSTGKKGGRAAKPPAARKSDPVAVLVTLHKNGSQHRTAVTQGVLEAAKRIRELGHLPEFHLHFVLRQISGKLKLEVPVTPGAFRHTVATEAIERGATPEQVSAFLGHKSPQTTKRFYATLAVAPKIPTLA